MLRLTSNMTALCALALAAGCTSTPISERFVDEKKEQAELRDFALQAYDEGVRFAEAGNHEIAVERFNRSVNIDPRPAAYFQMGRSHEALEDKNSAALDYIEALRAAPDFQEARIALMESGFQPPDEAAVVADAAAYDKFAEEARLEVAVRRAEAERKGREMTPEQREELRLKIQSQMAEAGDTRMPTMSEVRSALFPATVADAEVMPSATDPTFTSERDIILNTYPYHFGNGQRFQRNQQYEKAAIEYELALRIDPTQMEARLNLGDCMLRLERFPQAKFHFSSALEQFPASPRPLFKLGNFYESSKRTDLARDFYKQAIAKDPKYFEAYNNMAAIEIREANYPEAIQLLKIVLESNPGYTLAWLNLGVAQENSGDRAGALASYKKYVELGGDQASEVSKWIAEME